MSRDEEERQTLHALYRDLSARFVDEAAAMPSGPWRERFMFALETSLGVLRPHRASLTSLLPLLVGRGEDDVFASATAFARERVQGVFLEAVASADDAPPPEVAAAMGLLLYFMHLGVILWWLLERSPGQRATDALVEALHRGKPLAALGLHLPYAKRFVVSAAAICREGLFGEPGESPSGAR